MNKKDPIKRNQVWKQKGTNFRILIHSNKGGIMWKCKVLTEKEGVYNGSHTMTEYTLRKRYDLCDI